MKSLWRRFRAWLSRSRPSPHGHPYRSLGVQEPSPIQRQIEREGLEAVALRRIAEIERAIARGLPRLTKAPSSGTDIES